MIILYLHEENFPCQTFASNDLRPTEFDLFSRFAERRRSKPFLDSHLRLPVMSALFAFISFLAPTSDPVYTVVTGSELLFSGGNEWFEMNGLSKTSPMTSYND